MKKEGQEEKTTGKNRKKQEITMDNRRVRTGQQDLLLNPCSISNGVNFRNLIQGNE